MFLIAGIALLITTVLVQVPAGVTSIGVCYGMNGDNLPEPSQVISLYKASKIGSMRLYIPDSATLQALNGSNIKLLLNVPNTDLQTMASNASAASSWVQNNILAYWPGVSFRYIVVGNEVIPGTLAKYVLPAMKNIINALSSAGLQNQIKISTSVSTGVLGWSFPSSAGAFSSAAQSTLNPIIQFLVSNGSPLLVNVYPYFSYADNSGQIALSYALFSAPKTDDTAGFTCRKQSNALVTASGTEITVSIKYQTPSLQWVSISGECQESVQDDDSRVVVKDGQYSYENMFDAIVDAVYAALEKVGGSNVSIVVSESGWPSAGGTGASVRNAQTYNQNLIKHVPQGTPRRPGKALEIYIYGMFNENQKISGVEQNFGLFYPIMQPVYQLNFA